MSITSSWFRSGTVTVTKGQRVVQGFSTAWVSHLTPIGTGDAFTTDFTTFYEVVEIISDTQFRLDRAYAGTTASKVPYAIVRNGSSNFSVRTASAVQKSLAWYQEQLGIQNKLLTEDGDVVIDLPTGESITLWSEKKKQAVFEAHDAALTKLESDKRAEMDALLAENFYREFAMSKAEFEALRDARRKKYAGSGYVEPGLHYAGGSKNVNEGLWDLNGRMPNSRLYWGRQHTSGQSNGSKTYYPVLNIDGIQFRVEGLGYKHPSDINTIYFPPAPMGDTTFDSTTGEVINYSTDVDPKYGDVATTKSEAVARAFEGIIKHGDMRNSASWSDRYNGERGTATYSEEGYWTVTDTTGAGFKETAMFIEPSGPVEVKAGVTYTVDITIECTQETVVWARIGGYNKTHTISPRLFNGRNIIEFEATEDRTATDIVLVYVGGNGTAKIHNVFMRKQSVNVITSRRDYAFIEAWPERVSTRGVLCVYGMVQNAATYWKSHALKLGSTLGIPPSYGAFGTWQKDNDFYYLDLATASKIVIKNFLQDPDNNCFFDPETNELYQWRFRVRTVAGYGPKWDCTVPSQAGAVCYAVTNNCSRVMPQGKLDTPQKGTDLSPSESYGFYSTGNTFAYDNPHNTDAGLFSTSISTVKECSDLGQMYAIPLVLVQRMNTGAYHPGFNILGCDMFRVTTGWASRFDSSTIPDWAKPRHPKDCFDTRKIGASGGDTSVLAECTNPRGFVASNYSGRLDRFMYYDTVHAEQVKDLRLPAQKLDPTLALTSAVTRALNGRMRGEAKTGMYFLRVDQSLYSLNRTLISLKQYSNHEGVGENAGVLLRAGKAFRVIKYTNTYWFEIREITTSGEVAGDFTAYWPKAPEQDGTVIVPYLPGTGNKMDEVQLPNRMLCCEYESYFDTYTHIDLVVDPTDVALEFPCGLYGTLVDKTTENGITVYNASEKVAAHSNRLLYTIQTKTWEIRPDWSGTSGDVSKNQLATRDPSPGWIRMYQYEHQAKQVEPYPTGIPTIKALYPFVFVGSVGVIERGARLCSSLLHKALTGKNVPYNQLLAIQTYSANTEGGLNTSSSSPTIHAAMALGDPGNDSVLGCKFGAVLIEKAGLLYPVFYGQELRYTTTNWGDDAKLPLQGAGTKTDLNGVTLSTFCKVTKDPIGIAHIN